MSSRPVLHYLAYGYPTPSQKDLKAFLAVRDLQTTSIADAKPYNALDIEIIAPNNIDKLRSWISRPRTLANGTVLHFAEVSRPYGGLKYQNVESDELMAQGCSLQVLGQLVIGKKNAFLLHAIYDGRLASARAFADAGACIDPKYEATHASELRLWTAVLHGDFDELRRRIDAGDSVDQAPQGGNAKNWSPLSLCANLGRHEMAEVLLDHGANVEGIEGELMTPVVVAASADDVHLMKLFVEHGAVIDIDSHKKYGLVQCACRMGSCNALDYLIENHGLNLTAERVVASCCAADMVAHTEKVLDHYNFTTAGNAQFLLFTIDAHNMSMLKRMLDAGLDIDEVYTNRREKKTALLMCVAADWAEGVTELLRLGALDSIRGLPRPIELCVKLGKWDMAKVLTSLGYGYHNSHGQRKTLMLTVTPANDTAQEAAESLLREYLGINVSSISREEQLDDNSVTFRCECHKLVYKIMVNRDHINFFDHHISMSSAQSPQQQPQDPARNTRNN